MQLTLDQHIYMVIYGNKVEEEGDDNVAFTFEPGPTGGLVAVLTST